jgi:hypothetical protein
MELDIWQFFSTSLGKQGGNLSFECVLQGRILCFSRRQTIPELGIHNLKRIMSEAIKVTLCLLLLLY